MGRTYYGYRIVAASCVIQIMYLGGMFSYGVFFPELEAEFGWSRATISGASSLMFLMMGVLEILLGKLNDILGPRILLTVSTALFAVGYMLMSCMTTVWELYLFYGMLAGIGIGAHDVATLSTVARWFVRYRGLMSGMVKTGAGIGQLIGPLAAGILVNAYGWRQACLFMGLFMLASLVLVSQVMRRDPEEMGLSPLGGGDEETGKSGEAECGLNLTEALKTRSFISASQGA